MKRIVISLLLAASSVASSASAATIVYTSQASYLAALGGSAQTEDFADTTLVPGLSITSTAGNIASGRFNDRVVLGEATTSFTFGSAINGFGAIFDETPGGFGEGLDFLIDGTSLVTSLSGAASGTFLGFISDSPFTSVLIRGGTSSGTAETYNLDDLTFGTSVVSAAPEPTTWALMLVGFGVVGFAIRRRRTMPGLTLA